MMFKMGMAAFSLVLASACAAQARTDIPAEITTVAADGVAIYGTSFGAELGADAPLILLFHQGGSNGRAEYEWIAPWLASQGYRSIAWDQRSGGENYFGGQNRTVLGLPDGKSAGYCEAAPDLQAAVDYVIAEGFADDVVVWGSSYSAALVVRMAADNPETIAGVIAFSPPSGGPLSECLARDRISEVTVPVFVLRSASEMGSDSSFVQRDALTAAGARFFVVENGVHGSSMLVDARTEADMSAVRQMVVDWLESL